MELLISGISKEQATEHLKELKGLTQEQAKEKFEKISDKEYYKIGDKKYFYFTNLVYLYIADGGVIEKDIDKLFDDLNHYITNQEPENDVLDKLILKQRKRDNGYSEWHRAKLLISNYDSYSLSA